MSNEISVERRDDGVALLTLRAPGRRNALTVDMAEALVDACDELDSDHTVGAVVVRGEGGFFCAAASPATPNTISIAATAAASDFIARTCPPFTIIAPFSQKPADASRRGNGLTSPPDAA